jgi:moderate conductance mechanosensitive channel
MHPACHAPGGYHGHGTGPVEDVSEFAIYPELGFTDYKIKAGGADLARVAAARSGSAAPLIPETPNSCPDPGAAYPGVRCHEARRGRRGAPVTGAIGPLTDFSAWARGNLLVIVLLVLGTVLFTRLAIWVRDRVVARIDASAREADELVRSEAAKHRHVAAEVVTWAVLALVYIVTAVLVVQRLGVPLAGLVAPAALLSAALGFGLQRFVQDVAAGFFITGERQYGFGDVVRIEVAGVSQPAVGTVEDVTLRVTRIRSVSGEVITTPNGQIIQVTNLSRDWARAVVDVPVPSVVDVSRVTDILKRVGQEAYGDDRLRKLLLDPPTVMGVERIEVDTFSVRIVARTLPGAQFDVGRELRARVASAFRREGVNVSADLETSRATGGAS